MKKYTSKIRVKRTKEDLAAYRKEYRKLNPEKFNNNPDRKRDWEYKRKYGISLNDYQEMFDAQLGSCAICETIKVKEDKTMHVDHCHTTGKVRGLLCGPCNMALGLLKDNTKIINKMLSYINREEQNG